MKLLKMFARILTLALLALALAGPAVAQFAHVEGEIRDLEGKPFPDVTIVVKNKDSGQVLETKTDKNGLFIVNGLRLGIWELTVKVKGDVAWGPQDIQVKMGGAEKVFVNFKELIKKEDASMQEARKKQEEERTKFQGLKAHFDAGRAALDQAITAKNEMQKLPAAERGPLTEKLTQTSGTAISEFELAKEAAAAGDPNLHIVMSNLGQAYDIAGRYEDAIVAFSKAVELKADIAGYYQALGTAQARAGKVTDAMGTCDRAATLPTTAAAADVASVTASCYGNVGIILQNGAKMKESIEPLKKATTLNPANADYWFLLARGLVAAMEYKTEGGTMKTIIVPGTAESYQKYLELAPSGRFAQEAKDGLAMLEAIAPGIQTKVSTKKKKS